MRCKFLLEILEEFLGRSCIDLNGVRGTSLDTARYGISRWSILTILNSAHVLGSGLPRRKSSRCMHLVVHDEEGE